MRTAVLVSLVAIGLALTIAGIRVRGAAAAGTAPLPPIEIGSGPLTEDDFWLLVDHSAVLEAQPDAQLADLRRELGRLKSDQVAGFEHQFDALMRRSFTWDLWGAAYVANGGASDDGFEYFRCWLISKGRSVFEKVTTHPDDLADLLAGGERGGDLEFDDFAYVARDVWAKKTGRDWNAMPHIANMAYDAEPTGTPFEENSAALAARYPKLWRRFGH